MDNSSSHQTKQKLEGHNSGRGGGSYLEDGVHDAGKRPVVGVFWNGEDVQAPFVEVLQLLGQQLLLIGLDAEARDAAAGERGPVGDLLDPADLCHQLLLLLLLLLSRLGRWWRDLHLILFVWGRWKWKMFCCCGFKFPFSLIQSLGFNLLLNTNHVQRVGCPRTKVHYRNTCSWLVPEGFIVSLVHSSSVPPFIGSFTLPVLQQQSLP